MKRALEGQARLTLLQGRGGGAAHRRRAHFRRAHGAGLHAPVPRRRGGGGRLPQKPHPDRRLGATERPVRADARGDALGRAFAPRHPGAPLQDRHAGARARPQPGLWQDGAAGRGRAHARVLLPARAAHARADAVLPDLYERGDAPHHPRQTWSARPMYSGRIHATARATARRSRTRSSSFPTSRATRSSSSRKDSRRTSGTCRA